LLRVESDSDDLEKGESKVASVRDQLRRERLKRRLTTPAL